MNPVLRHLGQLALVGAASALCLVSPTQLRAAPDPDGGLARGYFRQLKLQPATVSDSGARGQNLVVIVIDALRPDHTSAYGYRRPTTPFLETLAEESLVFVNAYANAPWTRPATTSMLTGLLPSAHRTQSDRSKLPAAVTTVAQELKKLGYRTAAVVGNGNAGRIAGLDRGFDDFADTVTHWDGLPTAANVYDEAIEWLRHKRPTDQPWFLFVFLVDPHDPYHAPPEYERLWLGQHKGEPRRRVHWEYKNKIPRRERDAMIALYDASLRYTDDQTRRFVDELKRLKVYDQTSLMLTADHGEAFGEHGYYLHAYHHTDEFLRVPLIMRSPSLRGAGHVFPLAQSVDLAPTLIDLAGGTPRAGLHGQSLVSLVKAPVDPLRIAVSEYNEFGIRRSALFNLRHKVILQLPADRESFHQRIPRAEYLPSVSFDREVLQAYDRLTDPFEKKDLAAGELPATTRAMRDELRAYMLSAPSPNHEVDLETMPKSLVDDLRSLGYVQ